EAGYALRIHLIDERIWAAALHRFGLRSPATTSWEPGDTPLDAARNAWSTFEHRLDLHSFLPDRAEIERRGDRYYFLEAGTLIIRKGRGGAPWRLAWLPSDPGE